MDRDITVAFIPVPVSLIRAVIVIYFVKPFTTKKTKLIFWGISEVLVLATVMFWGVIIVGPIWFR